MRVANMIALLQVYIHIRKGVEVQIAMPQTKEDLIKLIQAHGYADKWLSDYETKITIL